MKKVAIFASGTGSNFEAICDNEDLKKIISIEWLICDKPNALVIEKAKKRNIKTFVFEPKVYASKQEYEVEILNLVQEMDYLFLAGYMRLISEFFLKSFQKPILNLHPSLLPKYKGKDAIKQAYDNGDLEIGISIHYVNEEMDGGEVIAQKSIKVVDGESLDDVTNRIHELEHYLYPKVIKEIVGGKNEKSIN